MLIVGTDIETTGLAIGEHRIIEVFSSLWDSDTRSIVSTQHVRINPQRSIDPAAQAVHKISLSDLAGEPIWDVVGPKVHAYLDQADLIVAHNGDGFDMPFLNYEFKKHLKLPEITKPTFDTMLNARWATPQGKQPNLGELCFACGVTYDPAKAHAAQYDVDRMMDCFWRGLEWDFYKVAA